jgi:hypothetical protein
MLVAGGLSNAPPTAAPSSVMSRPTEGDRHAQGRRVPGVTSPSGYLLADYRVIE